MTVEPLHANPEKPSRGLTFEQIDAALDLITCKDAEARDSARRHLQYWSRYLPELLIEYNSPLKKKQRKKLAAAGRWGTGYYNAIARLDGQTKRELVRYLAFARKADGACSKVDYAEAERWLQVSLTVAIAVADVTADGEPVDEDIPGPDTRILIMEELAGFYCSATGKEKAPGRSISAITNRPSGPFYRFVEAIWPAVFGHTSGLQNTIRRWVEWREKEWEREFSPC
jgi:hypothetical protein